MHYPQFHVISFQTYYDYSVKKLISPQVFDQLSASQKSRRPFANSLRLRRWEHGQSILRREQLESNFAAHLCRSDWVRAGRLHYRQWRLCWWLLHDLRCPTSWRLVMFLILQYITFLHLETDLLVAMHTVSRGNFAVSLDLFCVNQPMSGSRTHGEKLKWIIWLMFRVANRKSVPTRVRSEPTSRRARTAFSTTLPDLATTCPTSSSFTMLTSATRSL